MPSQHKRRWEVGGPYPAVTIIEMVDPGCGGDQPETPAYDVLCQLWPHDQGDAPEEIKAIARLIAAAPELYDLLLSYTDPWSYEQTAKRAREIIARIDGE